MDHRSPSSVPRRTFLETAAAVGAGVLGHQSQVASAFPFAADLLADGLRIAPFRFDVTPPEGHSLCGGWIKPVVAVDDPLEAIGFVLLGAGKPIVICVVDWTGLLNEANLQWRAALAEAAQTTPDRVTVHCVHQHNAPFACLEAQRIVASQGDLPDIINLQFFDDCLDRARQAVLAGLQQARPINQVATGQTRVDRVAANRRILGPTGSVVSQRGSSSRNPEHQRLPEGRIDPNLKTVAFYDGDEKVLACHYYACHPMSYYGDGRVSSDFCGLARKRRQQDEPQCVHLYFNGCGGNIGAGKYNDGSPEMRPVLTQRIYDAIVQSEAALNPQPIRSLRWVTQDIQPPPDRSRWNEAEIMQAISDSRQPVVARNRPAYTVAFLRRCAQQIPITLSGLHINQTSLLHLPSESFVEYQLSAQSHAPERFVACAAYGDGGPWYIPTAAAYPQGGYAVSVAWCAPQIDEVLTNGIRHILGIAAPHS